MRTVTVTSDREVDALVAEHVMGWRLGRNKGVAGGWFWVGDGVSFGDVPRNYEPYYTSDPVACAQLKAKLREQGWDYTISFQHGAHSIPWDWHSVVVDCDVMEGRGAAHEKTEERAVALAALKAHGIDVQYEVATNG